jgi:hypothetical protein
MELASVVVVKGAERVAVGGCLLRVLPGACVREEARWSEAEEVEKKEEAVALLRVCNVAQRSGLKYCKSILLDAVPLFLFLFWRWVRNETRQKEVELEKKNVVGQCAVHR